MAKAASIANTNMSENIKNISASLYISSVSARNTQKIQ
jgi:hypothetical protein